MTVVAEQYSYVVGADTHARTHTYAVIEAATGRLTGQATFPASAPGISRALAWIAREAPGPVLAAVEGTGSYGAGLNAALRTAGVPVAEAHPPKRAERRHGKSDAIDAEAAARSVLRQQVEMLATPRAGKIRAALRILLGSRRTMDCQRTGDRNALTALTRSIDLSIDARRPLTDRQVREIAAWRIHPTDDVEQHAARSEASRLARSVLTLTIELRRNLDELRHHSNTLAPGLLDKPGIGPFSAAIMLTAWSHPGRVRSEAAFAALAGAAPIPASSGNTSRHRLNRHGDRQLNRALDIVARARLSCDPTLRPTPPADKPKAKPRARSGESSSATSPARSIANSPPSTPEPLDRTHRRVGLSVAREDMPRKPLYRFDPCREDHGIRVEGARTRLA